MDNSTEKKQSALEAALLEEGTTQPWISTGVKCEEDIINMAKKGSHDHAVMVINAALEEMRTACPDSLFVPSLADALTEITSDRKNVKNAGAILGLSPWPGRPPARRAEESLFIASEVVRNMDQCENINGVYESVGEQRFGSGGLAANYEANRVKVLKMYKKWEVFFNNADKQLINDVLIENDIEPLY